MGINPAPFDRKLKPENPCKSRVFGFLHFLFSIDFAEHLRYFWGMIYGTILESIGGVTNEIHNIQCSTVSSQRTQGKTLANLNLRGSKMDNLMYSVASEDDIVFINETYNENIDRLHGVQRNVDVWKELMSCKDSTYYVVNAETPVAWFRIDMEDGGLWIGMLQVKPMYQHKGIGKYVLSAAENIAREKGYKRIGIHTTEDNIIARALYLSAGYTVTEIGSCTTADGKERVGYTFQKEI